MAPQSEEIRAASMAARRFDEVTLANYRANIIQVRGLGAPSSSIQEQRAAIEAAR